MGALVSEEKPWRVYIADDQPIFRLGVASLLESAFPEWDIIEGITIEERRSQLLNGSIDLLIVESNLLGQELDRGLPIGGGMNLWVDIIAVTPGGDAIGALGCLGAGAHATVSRSDTAEQLLNTVELLVMRRQNRQNDRQRAHSTGRHDMVEAPPGTLSLGARQMDVLRLLAKGQSNKVIARDLGLSVSTVKVHLNTVFRALGARNRVEAVVLAQPYQSAMTGQQS